MLINKKPHIIYCFKKKYSIIYQENGPKEFFYGFDYVKNHLPSLSISSNNYPKNHPLKIVEEILAQLSKVGCHFQIYLNNKELFKSNPNSVIFSVEDGTSFGVLFFKLIGLLNNKTIVLIQGLHDRYQNYKFFRWNKPLVYFYGKLLDKADIILTLSKYEKDLLVKSFNLNSEKVKVLNFGADLNYWNKKEASSQNTSEEFALTIGNDMHRDYDLLINHYNLKIPLKFVTKRLNINQQKRINNCNIFEYYQEVSNDRLRQLYGQAKFVIIPLKTTYATSGLSTIVQALAMEKPVLVADAPSLKELFQNNFHLLYYQTNNPISFKQKLHELSHNKALRSKLAKNGRKIVEEKYNAQNMGKNILSFVQSLIDS